MTTTQIPLAKPHLDEREVEAAARVVRSGWLAQGKEVAALEEEFASYLDPSFPPYVVAVSSGTTALELVLRVIDVHDTPVICPSYTFVASANAALYCGAKVHLSDILAETYNINPGALPLSVDLRNRHVIMAVHQVGLPCDVDGLLRASPGALIVEDGACAIGARYPDGRRVGARGDTVATCFSLHGSKSIVAGEGGLIATRSKEVADRVRRLRQHGVDIAAEVRKGAEREQYTVLGYNYRMTDIQAAIARVQIQKADEIVSSRRNRADFYSVYLGQQKAECVVPSVDHGHAFQRYLIRTLNPDRREMIVEALASAGISCRRGLQVIHRQPYWKTPHEELLITEMVADTTIQLPLWTTMTVEDQNRVIDAILEVKGNEVNQ